MGPSESTAEATGPVSGRRFAKQVRFAPLGPAGQQRLEQSRVLVVGVGALGCALAQSMVRSGVGTVVLVDRDIVDVSNLPRQVLFSEEDAARSLPKVEAAARELERIGGPTRLDPRCEHLGAHNVATLLEGIDLVLDGTDNLATRYLLNDACVRAGLPWIYGGVVGSGGMVLAVRPGSGPCLRCVFPEPPPLGSLETCDSAGVLQPAVAAVAALQAGAALRLLAQAEPSEGTPSPTESLLECDVWTSSLRRLELPRDPDCPACGRGDFEFLDAAVAEEAVALCGRNAVQVPAPPSGGVDLAVLSQRVERSGAASVARTGLLLRFEVEELRLTVFPDGRALVEGCEDPVRARAVVDRWIGA